MAAPQTSETVVPRVAACQLGDSSAPAAALRRLRDAGQEVVYLGVLDPAQDDLDRRLAAVCVQEDVDALVLLGEVPAELPGRVQDRLRAADEAVAVLLAVPDLIEQVARAARLP